MDRKIVKIIRGTGVVSLNLAILSGCGDVEKSPPVNPQEMFKRDAVRTDRSGGEEWRQYLDAMVLHRAWAPPAGNPWRAFYKPALVAAVTIVRSAAYPIHGSQQTQAETDAVNAIALMSLDKSCLIVDLPGEESVAWGAVLAEKGIGVPIPTFYNWPHQREIVPLQRTLGALIYYASSVERARGVDLSLRHPIFLLEGLRLVNKGSEMTSDDFDNRYFYVNGDFPSAATLRGQNIENVYYVSRRQIEEDDLNEYFLKLKEGGIHLFFVRVSGSSQPTVQAYIPSKRETIFSGANDDNTHHLAGGYRGYHGYYGHSRSYWPRFGSTFGGGHSFSG